MNRTLWLCAMLTTALASGCANPGAQPTVKSATDVLNQVVDATLAGDFEAVCSRASTKSMCQSMLTSGLQDRAPKARPNVVCSYVLPDRRTGTQVAKGGQMLLVQGIDGQNRPFVTDFLVFQSDGALVALNPIWWSNMGVGRVNAEGTGTTPPQGGERHRCGP